jgi:hypothetical protein
LKERFRGNEYKLIQKESEVSAKTVAAETVKANALSTTI